MPLYQFECPKCGKFEVYKPVERCSEPQLCECGQKADRVFGLAGVRTDDNIPSDVREWDKVCGHRLETRDDMRRLQEKGIDFTRPKDREHAERTLSRKRAEIDRDIQAIFENERKIRI